MTHNQSSIQPSHSDVGLDRLKNSCARSQAKQQAAAAAASKKSIPIQLSQSDVQLNYDRRVPDVLNPEIIEEEDDSSYSKKSKNSRKSRRQKRKKQSVASGELSTAHSYKIQTSLDLKK